MINYGIDNRKYPEFFDKERFEFEKKSYGGIVVFDEWGSKCRVCRELVRDSDSTKHIKRHMLREYVLDRVGPPIK